MAKQFDHTQLNHTQCVEHLNQIHQDVKEIDTAKRYSTDNNQHSMLHEIQKLRTIVEKINFGNLSKRQKIALGTILFGDLTATKNWAVLKSHTKLWEDFGPRARRSIYRHQVAVQKIVNQQADNQQPVPVTTITSAGWQPENQEEPVVFPAYTSGNQQINLAYTHLRGSWEQAGLKVLTTEDTYLLVALATNYLPESINLVQRLSRHSELARNQCEQMFLEQLRLMQQQVDVVLAKESDTILSAMQAHTRFLAQKVPMRSV